MRKKNNLLAFAILIIGIVLIFASSCKKDDKEDDNNVTPVSTDKITATIGGNAFVATDIIRQSNYGNLVITGLDNIKSLGICLFDTLKVGTYSLGQFGTKCNLQHAPNINGTEIYSSISGTLVLTEFSATGKIKGTFNAVLNKINKKGTNINITNGVIDVSN
jgi:hypothetical protein